MRTPQKVDRRVRYTKKAIRESFYALLAEKPIEKISVTDICKGADINRGTFYSHYSDPFDLRKSLTNELVEAMSDRMDELGVTKLTSVQTFKLCRDNRELCKVFAGPNGDRLALLDIITAQADAYLGEYMKQLSSLPEIRQESLRKLIIGSITIIVQRWFDTDLEAEPEVVADVLDTYVLHGLGGFVTLD